MANNAISDKDFGVRLCEILGLNPSKTRDITILCRVNDVVMVQVDQYLQSEEADKFLELTKQFTLIKDDESFGPDIGGAFKRRRHKQGLSIRDVTAKTGLSAATISRIERNKDHMAKNFLILRNFYDYAENKTT